MTKYIVIPPDHHIARPPALFSAVLLMALDIYHAPGWLWGVVATLLAVLWLMWGLLKLHEERKPLPGYGITNAEDESKG